MTIQKFDIVAIQAIIAAIGSLTLALFGNYAASIVSLCLSYTSMEYANKLASED